MSFDMLESPIDSTSRTPMLPTPSLPWAGDGCWHIYLDVGSNIGVQVRKLFEPNVYHRAVVSQRVFNHFFGRTAALRQRHVCAIGIEANPRHEQRLQQLQHRYESLGWRTRFLTRTVGGSSENMTRFYLDNSNDPLAKGTEWWASTVRHPMQLTSRTAQWEYAVVRTIDLASWMRRILHRKLPPPPTDGEMSSRKPRIVMKLDIEGGEYDVLPHLLMRGLICRLDYLWAEIHDGQSREHAALARGAGLPNILVKGGFRHAFRYLVKQATNRPNCEVRVVDDSDESFGDDPFPLPEQYQ